MTDTATMRSPKPLPQNDRDKAESVDETLHLETSERAQEDAMEWKDVFSIRVCLCLLVCGLEDTPIKCKPLIDRVASSFSPRHTCLLSATFSSLPT